MDNSNMILKYKLKREPIASGSFSDVYLGYDSDGGEYAIKQIDVQKLDPNRLDKFLLELDISVKISHPNIVKCYEIFKTDNYWYMVSEYCNSQTLRELIKESKKLDNVLREECVKTYIIQLKNALHYLHSNNIIHRDLKPANILLTKSGDEFVLKLADFGFARYFRAEETQPDGHNDMVSTLCGSPIYMAPELLVENKYNMKADLWSFGVIMYEFIYGVNPYFFPKNIPELKKLMTEQSITYQQTCSGLAVDLMKSLLVIDPRKRISWENFFNHPWFGENISSVISDVEIIDDYMVCDKNTVCDEVYAETKLIQPVVYKYKTYGEKISNSFIRIVGGWFGW